MFIVEMKNLSPGGHAVASENALYDLHINVCREITPSKNITTSHTHGCPSGTSSCRVLKSGKKDDMGQITQLSKLKPNPFNPKQIVLHYNASNTGTSCREPPSTTIVFECPELFHQAVSTMTSLPFPSLPFNTYMSRIFSLFDTKSVNF